LDEGVSQEHDLFRGAIFKRGNWRRMARFQPHWVLARDRHDVGACHSQPGASGAVNFSPASERAVICLGNPDDRKYFIQFSGPVGWVPVRPAPIVDSPV